MSTLMSLPEVAYVVARMSALRARLPKTNEAGYSTEAVIVTATLAALAIVVLGIISVKVVGAANNLQTS